MSHKNINTYLQTWGLTDSRVLRMCCVISGVCVLHPFRRYSCSVICQTQLSTCLEWHNTIAHCANTQAVDKNYTSSLCYVKQCCTLTCFCVLLLFICLQVRLCGHPDPVWGQETFPWRTNTGANLWAALTHWWPWTLHTPPQIPQWVAVYSIIPQGHLKCLWSSNIERQPVFHVVNYTEAQL